MRSLWEPSPEEELEEVLEKEGGRKGPVAQDSSFLLQGVITIMTDFQCLGFFLLSSKSSGWQLLQQFEMFKTEKIAHICGFFVIFLL